MHKRFKYIILLWNFLKPHKVHFIACIVIVLINSVILGGTMTLALPVLSQLFDADFIPDSTGDSYFAKAISFFHNITSDFQHKEVLSLGILFSMMLVSAVLQFVTIYFNSGLTAKITCDCRNHVYSAVQGLSLKKISEYSHGAFIQLIITETRSVYAVFKQLLNLSAEIINIAILILLLLLLSPMLSGVLLVGLISSLLINLSITRSIKRLGKKALKWRTELATHITEGISGLKQLRLIQGESVMKSKINKISACSENTVRSLRIKTGLLPLTSQTFSFITVIMVVIAWMYFPIFPNGVPRISGVLTFLFLVAKLTPCLGGLSREYGSIFSNIPAIGRLDDFLSKEIEIETSGELDTSPFLSKSIVLEDIFFEYTPGHPVLNGLTFKIEKGAYIGLVGPSGGGKSTLFNLLLRLYDFQKGRILIDDTDISQFKLSHLRKSIGIVSQDFFLFNASIKENMLLARPEATDGDVRIALEKAGVSDTVESFENGINTLIGNNGSSLSGGQRQRLSLAMLFLRDPEVIILDEGTSSVDKKTEEYILSSLRDLHKGGKTIICSAHKESALLDAEIIYELKDGIMKRL